MAETFLNKEDFTDAISAYDLYVGAVRNSLPFDTFEKQTSFRAVVLTRPIELARADLDTAFSPPEPGSNSISKFAFKGRIIDDNSPHQYLPNPCVAKAVEGLHDNGLLKIYAMHTTFISSDDYTVSAAGQPKAGDIVNVELDVNVNSYNLQFGRFISIASDTKGGGGSVGELSQACVNMEALFGRKFNYKSLGEEGFDIAAAAESALASGGGKARSSKRPSKKGGPVPAAANNCNMAFKGGKRLPLTWEILGKLYKVPAIQEVNDMISSGEGSLNSINRGEAGDSPGTSADYFAPANIDISSWKSKADLPAGYSGVNISELTVGEVRAYQNGCYSGRKLAPGSSVGKYAESHVHDKGKPWTKPGTKGRVLAVGRFQIIPCTLEAAMKALKIPNANGAGPVVKTTGYKFDSDGQQRLGTWLLLGKRPYLGKYILGFAAPYDNPYSAVQEMAAEYASWCAPCPRKKKDASGVLQVICDRNESFHCNVGGNKCHKDADWAVNFLKEIRARAE